MDDCGTLAYWFILDADRVGGSLDGAASRNSVAEYQAICEQVDAARDAIRDWVLANGGVIHVAAADGIVSQRRRTRLAKVTLERWVDDLVSRRRTEFARSARSTGCSEEAWPRDPDRTRQRSPRTLNGAADRKEATSTG